MSFARAFSRKVLPLNRTRLFTTTPYVQKTATEQAKETIQKVNKAVSEPLVKGIEKGRKSHTLPLRPLTSPQPHLTPFKPNANFTPLQRKPPPPSNPPPVWVPRKLKVLLAR